jgi:hypothetical protein
VDLPKPTGEGIVCVGTLMTESNLRIHTRHEEKRAMKKPTVNPFLVALLGQALVIAAPAAATEESALPSEPQAQTPATESVRPQVEKKASDKALEKRKKILDEATAAIAETKNALKALEGNKVDDALKALEIATGKLELIIARDPELALAPVDVTVVTYDLLASPDTVKEVIDEAEDYLEDGEIQEARPLVANLASEIVFRTTSIPLATYPDAMKEVTTMIDEGKIDEAKAALQAALSTLVVTTDDVIPLPVLRAERLLKKAEKLGENDKRTLKDNENLSDLLKEARTQLKMGELLGYGTKESFASMYEQLDKIEQKTADGKGGEGWFDKIKQQLSELF